MIEESTVKQKSMALKRETLEKPSRMCVFRPKIELGTCEKNYDCVIFCPRNAITINNQDNPVIHLDSCDGCLICLRVCPTVAIKEEEK